MSRAAIPMACAFLILVMQANALRLSEEPHQTELVFSVEGCSENSLDDINALRENLEQGEREWRESGTDAREYALEQALANEVQAKRICQTGFNTGVSALAFLCAAKDTFVYSYDLGAHGYVAPQSAFIAEKFPGRHEIVLGDSTKTLPDAIEQGGVHRDMLCDLAFVDGGHMYEVALADIRNFRNLTKRGGRLLVDNCNSDGIVRGHGGMKQVNEAYQTALKEGIVTHERQVRTGCEENFKVQNCRDVCVASF